MNGQNFGFAKLVSLNGDEFYIKSPTLILGRNQLKQNHNNSQAKYQSDNNQILSFCPLSTSKQISRNHAKIYFNFSSMDFQILCICKNDIFVDEKIVSKKDKPVSLKNGSSIVIGDFVVMFMLPKNFSEQLRKYRTSKKYSAKFDLNITKPPKVLKQTKNSLNRPKEKLLSIVKLIICEHPKQKMTLQAVITAIENKYKNIYPEFLKFSQKLY